MSKNYVPILCLAFLPGCYGATDESDAGPPTVDAYTPTDAGPAPTPETDAGADAGAVSSCSDELPNPTAWDCATSEPSGTVGAAIEAAP